LRATPHRAAVATAASSGIARMLGDEADIQRGVARL
jgi:hypothetical protein